MLQNTEGDASQCFLRCVLFRSPTHAVNRQVIDHAIKVWRAQMGFYSSFDWLTASVGEVGSPPQHLGFASVPQVILYFPTPLSTVLSSESTGSVEHGPNLYRMLVCSSVTPSVVGKKNCECVLWSVNCVFIPVGFVQYIDLLAICED